MNKNIDQLIQKLKAGWSPFERYSRDNYLNDFTNGKNKY